MNIISKIIALFMSIITMFSSMFFSPPKEPVQTEEEFSCEAILPTIKSFDISLDEKTKEICDYIKENSYLDIEQLVTNLPDVNDFARFFAYGLKIDTNKFRDMMFDLRDKLYDDGKQTESNLMYLIGAYFSVFESCEICLVPKQGELYEFVLKIQYANDYSEDLYTGVLYDESTGEFFSNNGEKGMVGIGFNFNIIDMVVYTPIHCWMREFGFCLGYDLFSYATPFYFYNTRRFKFDYAGKEWMIQIWKGNYMTSNGAEVGIYNRAPEKDGTYYDCASDEDMMNMTLKLTCGNEFILYREGLNWWINGFKLTKNLHPAKSMTMDFSIEMKDEEMLKAFCEAIDNNVHQDVTYTVEGLKVCCQW